MNRPIQTGTTSKSFEEPDSEPPSGHAAGLTIEQTDLITTTRVLFPTNRKTQEFRERHFPQTNDREWNSWHWQLKNSATCHSQLERFLKLSEEELFGRSRPESLPIRVTPYYLSLMNPDDPSDPLRRSMIPVANELFVSDYETDDPLGEKNQSPLPNLVHRYPDRALFLVTGFCASYCRYCTRTHMVAGKSKSPASLFQWRQAIDYISSKKEIRDVIISGGDPLSLPDSAIDFLLNSLFTIPHIEMVRIGTKMPVVLPQRVTPALVRILKKYQPLYMNIHFTHPAEMTIETKMACSRLANAGIPLGSQTVLLKGINDSVETMKALMHELLKSRVRPY